jgi:hypothetical protein
LENISCDRNRDPFGLSPPGAPPKIAETRRVLELAHDAVTGSALPLVGRGRDDLNFKNSIEKAHCDFASIEPGDQSSGIHLLCLIWVTYSFHPDFGLPSCVSNPKWFS